MTTTERRILAIEDHHRRAGPGGHPEAIAALDWAMAPQDRRTWSRLVDKYEQRLGPAPETVSPEDLDPADLATLEDVFRRAYRRLGWPCTPEPDH